MGIKRPADRIPRNVLRIYEDVVEQTLPRMVPSIIPSVIQSTLVMGQIKPVGNYTLTINDAGKSICGGNAAIFVPTDETVDFPVVTTINIVTEADEFIIQPVNKNITSIYYNNNPVAGEWIIPPRTMAQLCKIDNNTWNIQGQNLVRF